MRHPQETPSIARTVSRAKTPPTQGPAVPANGPKLFTLRQACKEDGAVLPLSYAAARQRKAKCKATGRAFPEGITHSGVTRYSRQELTEWFANEPDQKAAETEA
ncbi:hypothetical protein [Streptomyces sioyaensis]|uniref:hypothetical protein n=1 Tax=Streptomyces sioyaensis TaxID=67364 RepID=UPI0036E71A39